jgi:DNA adenine methylase
MEIRAEMKGRLRVDEVPRPFLKMVGGKRRLLPELIKRIPKKTDPVTGEITPNVGRYHEHFVGGGALFWELRREGRISDAVLSDKDERLARAWRGVRDDVDGVIGALREHEYLHSREHFECMRTVTEFGSDALCAAWRIYVAQTSFNGLYRVNRKGLLNAPFGDYDRPLILDEENLRACSRALSGVEIHACDFEALEVACSGPTRLFFTPRPGDFVYLDPPYAPVSKTASFRGYTADGFTDDDHQRLAAHARRLKEAGASVLLTNSDAPLVRDLYPEPFWRVERVEARGNAVSCDGEGRGRVAELIIS